MYRAIFILTASLALGACGILPAGKEPNSLPRSATSAQAMPVSASAQQCLSQLSRTGSSFSAIPDKYYGAGCSTINSVRLSSLRGDKASFALVNLGAVACPTANAFAGWARFGVDRAARQILGSPLVRIETMGSYACRNVAGTSRRSAHANAEAIDIAAFILADGRRISVAEDWSGGTRQERDFLRKVHASGCKRFGTVLGPQYNAAHRDHFHFESGDGNFCR